MYTVPLQMTLHAEQRKAVEVPVWVGRARSGSPASPSHTWA